MGIFSKIFRGIGNIVTDIISWIIPIPEMPGMPEQSEFEKGILVNKQSNNASIPVVYGTRLLGGTRTFIEVEGATNQYLYICIVLCEGEINGINKIVVDDSDVTFTGSFAHGVQNTSNDSRFGSNIKVQPFFGTDDQVQSTLLNEDQTWNTLTNRKLKGVAYLAIRLEWDRDKFGGIPKIQAEVEGKKVKTIGSDIIFNTNKSFSTNPAFCLLDYLMNDRYGKGISIEEIDLKSFYDASVVADQEVLPFSGASVIPQFSLNVVLDTEKKIIDNVKFILRGMRGFLPYSEGLYRLIIETTGSSVLALNSDNIIGGVKLISEKKNTKYNRINIDYISPDKKYERDTLVFPETDSAHQTLKAADGGFLQELNLDLNMITNPYQALQFAKVVLNRSRNQLTIECTVNHEAMNLSVGDIVDLTDTILGMSAKPFRVIGLSINFDYTVVLTLAEHQDSWYIFDPKQQVAVVPDTTFPDPFSISPPGGVTLTDELIAYNDGTVIVALNIAITASSDNFVDEYQVEYKKSSESDFKVHARGSELKQRVLNVIDQERYDVRVKAINSIGVSSTYVSSLNYLVVGAVAPPSDVTEFAVNIVGSEAHLGWEQIPDLDLAFYQIRYSTVLQNATWENSVSIVEKVSRPATTISVPALKGTYLIKAFDKLGNASVNATQINTNITKIGNFNAVATQQEDPNFSGNKTNCSVVNGTLKLDDFSQDATYEFSQVIDIGASFRSRVTAVLEQFASDPTILFDAGRGFTNFDDVPTNILFDGTVPQGSKAVLQLAVSDDNVSYSPFKNFVIGDYSARFFKFRLLLSSRDANSIPVVTTCKATVDMEDRLITDNDVSSGTSTKSITFTTPFKSTTYAIGIAAQDMSSGDFYEISNKTANGFDIVFKNSSSGIVNKTFDFIAKGF
tara:strand:+ start:5448 stop:8165 length:2718 start_codon:yes stop_codon:yes gene_type:complete